MNFIKSIEYNLLHSKRAKLIKKYPRVRKFNKLINNNTIY